jgi:DNA-binding CsgD family transcriptional regulator
MDRRGEANTCPETVSPIDRTVDQLIRQLIEDDAREPATADADADEIILDMDVGGVRYLAIRCGSRPQHRVGPEEEESGHSESNPDRPTPLSPRELEIARMVAKGYANKSIATVLDISSWTVSSHLRRIYIKFGVTSRAAMVARLLASNENDPIPSAGDHVRTSEADRDRDEAIRAPAEPLRGPSTRSAPGGRTGRAGGRWAGPGVQGGSAPGGVHRTPPDLRGRSDLRNGA